MITLAEIMIIIGADNRPPMMEKSLYDSWKSRMEFYMKNRENGRMILDSFQNGPLVWPTVVQEDGTTRKKTYAELSATEKLQADCDCKAINIVLQGLPPDVYAIINHHKVAKEIWDLVKLLIQGTKLSLQEKECKLYDEFDKFLFVKVQVNTKFLNSLPPEWSLVVPVFNQGDDPIAYLNKAMAFLIDEASSRFHLTNNQLCTSSNPRNQATIQDGRVTVQQVQGRQGQSYASTGYKGECHMARQCTQPKRPRNAAWFKEKAMLAEAQEAGQILNEEQLAFLTDLALGYQNPFYLKKAQRIKPTLYDGSVISSQHVASPVIDDEETLILEEVSRSKMLAKQNDPMSKEKKVNTTPINYVELNRLSEDFGKRFVPQQELSDEQAFWLQTSHPNTDQSASSPVKIEAPKELPKHIRATERQAEQDEWLKTFCKTLRKAELITIKSSKNSNLRQTDNYPKYMKDLVANKQLTEEDDEVSMNPRCSSLLQNQLPPKENDPGSFILPCFIRRLDFNNALADLGASISIMPFPCLNA
ncbi:hypothetical protein Tco_1099881 [Tanacetum coccineum]